MLTRTNYAGDSGRRCDGCGKHHVDAGDDIYRVSPGELVIARTCIVQGAEGYTKLARLAADAWSRKATERAAQSMLDALDD